MEKNQECVEVINGVAQFYYPHGIDISDRNNNNNMYMCE